MRIYYICAKKGVSFDMYDGHVVIAHNETEARALCPTADEGWTYDDNGRPMKDHKWWTRPENAEVEILGQTTRSESHVVLSSFNAA